MNAPKVLPISMTFELWKSRGCPVDPLHNLRRVWPTSPYGKLQGDRHESVPTLAEQIKKKRKGKR